MVARLTQPVLTATGLAAAESPRQRPPSPCFQTASGAVIAISATGYDLGEPWLGAFRVRTEREYPGTPPDLQDRRFQAAPLGNSGPIFDRVLKGRITDEVSVQGGRFIVAHSSVDEGVLMAWQGRWNEVFDFVNDSNITLAQVLRRFDRLTFHDSHLGVRVEVGKIPTERIYDEQVHKPVPGVGYLAVLSPADAAGLVPKWRGATVRSGEVWRKEAVEGGRPILVHASLQAVTLLYPEGSASDEMPRLMFLDHVQSITWTAG